MKNFVMFDKLFWLRGTEKHQQLVRDIEGYIGRPLSDILWAPSIYDFQEPRRYYALVHSEIESLRLTGTVGDRWHNAGWASRLRDLEEKSVHINRFLSAFLKAWQELFPCEGFDFDYHFMWDHHRDPGQYAMAEVLHQDVQRLADIGLDGFISCQSQRVFFPTGLGMTVLGRTLWNRDATFGEIAEDYFASAFGEGADEARAYLASVSDLINPKLIRGEASDAEKRSAGFKLARVSDLVATVKPAVDRGLSDSSPARAASWRYLALHGDFACLFADAVAARLNETEDSTRAKAWTLFQWARDHEMELQPLFDIFEFQLTLGPFFGIPRDEATG